MQAPPLATSTVAHIEHHARRRIFAGLAASIYSRTVLVLGQLLLVPVLATRWGLSGYGEWVTITALAAYLSYTNIGMPGALRAHMAMAFSRNGRVAMQEAFQSSLALIMAVAGAVCLTFITCIQFMPLDRMLQAHWMGRDQAVMVASILGGQVAMYAVSSVFAAALSSVGEYPKTTRLNAHRQTFEMVAMLVSIGVFSAKPGAAAWIYLVSWSGYSLVLASCLWRSAPWLYSRPLRLRPAVLRELARPMFGVLGTTFGYYGMSVQAPRIILAAVAGPEATAVYAVASMMTQMVRIPMDLPAHAATVEISLAVGHGEIARGRDLLSNTTRVCLWLALTVTPCVVLLGPFVSSLWTNHRAQAPVDLLALMCISTVVFAVALPLQEGLMAISRLQRAAKWLLIGSAPFVALCWELTKTLGIDGAAIAVIGLDLLYTAATAAAVTRYFQYGSLRQWAASLGPPVALLSTEWDRLIQRWRQATED